MQGDFRIGKKLVSPALRSVQDDSGSILQLENKVMQVLVCLVEHPGELVLKEALIRSVWPDTFVTDDVLTRAISELRRIFGDDPKQPHVIQTVAKAGYRLIAPVEPTNRHHSNRMTTVPSRWIAVGLALLTAILLTTLFLRHATHPVQYRSLAVLPLENLSHDPRQEYFADGMTDELINELAQIKALRVVSRTSVMQFRGSRKSLSDIAKILNVDVIVEGAVLRADNRVRITAQLVDAKSDKQLWARKFDGDLRDVLTLEGDVAREIADEIRVSVTSQEHTHLTRARPVDPEAYDLYLQGFNFLWTHGWYEQGPKQSTEYFQQAIAKDPGLSPAYVGIADAHILLVDNGFEDPNVGYPIIEQATDKALSLDASLGEAHRAMGAVKEYQRDWLGAQKEFELAIKLIPGSARSHHWYAIRLANMGRHEESIAEARRAVELDPLENYYRVILGRMYYFARRYESAEAEVRKEIAVDASILPAHIVLADILVKMGRNDEAIVEIEKAQAITPDSIDPDRACIYALSGHQDKAIKLVQSMRSRSRSHFVPPTDFARVYSSLGDKEEALRWLEVAFVQRDTHLDGLKINPQWDPLRADPRFQDLLKRAGF
jgi:TolB-like protein/DNA-binding winged helix-turn-helix (wHTH) protein/tetratricopeptide (TPR) repeat protein